MKTYKVKQYQNVILCKVLEVQANSDEEAFAEADKISHTMEWIKDDVVDEYAFVFDGDED